MTRCKYCKQDDLSWLEIKPKKWRLVDRDNVVHSCDRREPEDDGYNDPDPDDHEISDYMGIGDFC